MNHIKMLYFNLYCEFCAFGSNFNKNIRNRIFNYPEYSGAIILAMFLSINFLTIGEYFDFVPIFESPILDVIAVFGSLIFVNWLICIRKSRYKKLLSSYYEKSNSSRVWWRLITLSYVIITILLTVSIN